jgi:hypothetical protein
VKNKPDYANLRIAHGKDRCANPPRSGPQNGGQRKTSGNQGSADAKEDGEEVYEVSEANGIIDEGILQDDEVEIPA